MVLPTAAEPCCRPARCGCRAVGLAQRAQHVLAQRRGVLRCRSARSAGWSSTPRSGPTAGRPDRRSATMTASSNRPAAVGVGGRRPVAVGLRSGRGCRRSPRSAGAATASPEWMVVASAVSTACASSGCRLQTSGGIRIWARGSVSGSQPSPQHRRHARPGGARPWSRGAAARQRSPDRTATGSVPAAASAAPTAGSNGAATTCGDSRRGVSVGGRGGAAGASPAAVQSAAAIATVLPWALSRSTTRPVRGPSPTSVAPRVDGTPRIWSTRSPAPLMVNALRAGSPTRCRASRSACAYGAAATHMRRARARSRSSQADAAACPVPGWLGGAQPVGRVGDDVAAGHRVDRDQQVGVDGQAQRAASLRRRGRRPGWWRTRLRASSVSSRPPAASEVGEVVVHQPYRGGAARHAGRQPRLVGQRPEHGDLHRLRWCRERRHRRASRGLRPGPAGAARGPAAGSARRRVGPVRRSRGCR